MTGKDIVKQYLKDNGYDGLCNPDIDCGCGLDNFAPCMDENLSACQPAYKHVGHCKSCDGGEEHCDNYDPDNENLVCYSIERPKRGGDGESKNNA